MNRLLLTAILVAFLWCGVELRHIARARPRPAPPTSGRPWPTTIHYYVPDGTCINVRNPEGVRQ